MPRKYQSNSSRGRGRSYGRSKPSWYDRKYSAKDLAIQALKNTNYIRGLVNSEMLHKDTTVSLSAATATIDSIVAIAQNDTVSTRTGNSILLKNIYFRGSLAINSAVTSNTRITLVLLKDTQQVSDVAPTLADIFTSPTDPDTLLSIPSAGRFKIIWRKTYVLTPVSGGKNAFDISKYIKCYDHIRFNGINSTDIQKNGYYFAQISSEVVNFPTTSFNFRVGYHDN